jgi:NAD(P)-dependent dehydrogenase (short-subunit alcohol dehydrogenase family)
MAELRGRRALVTGASKGIGYAIANRLHIEGATVLATARTTPSLPGGIQFVTADLVSVEGCATVAAAVRDRLGGIDIVVHVVGGSQRYLLLCLGRPIRRVFGGRTQNRR